MPPLLSIDDALARVLARARPLDAERVPVAAAAGRVLAEDVAARVDLPPFASSAMDGFAVRAADLPGPPAGRVQDRRRPAGRPAARARRGDGDLDRRRRARGSRRGRPDRACCRNRQRDRGRGACSLSGAHVRPAGGDVRAGDVLLEAGTVLGAAQVGALAAAGVAEVAVRAAARRRRPQHGHGAARAGGRARARADLRVERADAGGGVRGCGRDSSSGSARSPTTRSRIAPRSSAGSPPTCSSARAASRSGRTTSCAGSSPSSASRRTSGASPSGRGSRSRSAAAARRSSSACRATPSPRSSPSSCSCGRRCSRCREPRGPARTTSRARLASALRRNAARDELVRARTRDEAGEAVLEPLTGQESHMIARAAAADALVLVPAGRRRASSRRARPLPPAG